MASSQQQQAQQQQKPWPHNSSSKRSLYPDLAEHGRARCHGRKREECRERSCETHDIQKRGPQVCGVECEAPCILTLGSRRQHRRLGDVGANPQGERHDRRHRFGICYRCRGREAVRISFPFRAHNVFGRSPFYTHQRVAEGNGLEALRLTMHRYDPITTHPKRHRSRRSSRINRRSGLKT